jgi:hypothetical protein
LGSLQCLQGEEAPIHSLSVDLLLHDNGSARDASGALFGSAGVMALVLPITQILCSSGDDIGLALPTNLLVMDGLKPGGGYTFASSSFGSTPWETCFLTKFASSGLPFFQFHFG